MEYVGIYFGNNYITCSYIKNIQAQLYKKYKLTELEMCDGLIFNYSSIANKILEFFEVLKLYINNTQVNLVICLPEPVIYESFELNKISQDKYAIQEQIISDETYAVGILHESLCQFNMLIKILSDNINLNRIIFSTQLLSLYELSKYNKHKIQIKDIKQLKTDLYKICCNQDLFIEHGLYLLGKLHEKD